MSNYLPVTNLFKTIKLEDMQRQEMYLNYLKQLAAKNTTEIKPRAKSPRACQSNPPETAPLAK